LEVKHLITILITIRLCCWWSLSKRRIWSDGSNWLFCRI